MVSGDGDVSVKNYEKQLRRDELQKIFERDKACVYCHKTMIGHGANGQRGDWYSIEHLNYLPPWDNPKTVAIC